MTEFADQFDLPWIDTAVRLGLAVLLGGVIGIDREIRRRPAGLRTHMLVSLASAAFAMLTFNMFYAIGEGGNLDPIRITEAVITGVAFLGAGTIIRAGGTDVAGITTGASIWLAGAIGLAAGTGFFVLGAMITFAGVFVLTVVGWLEVRVFGGGEDKEPPAK